MSPASGSESGFTIVGLLLAVLAVNIALGVAMTTWVDIDRRAREAELIWRGNQYVRAIECYRAASGGLLPELMEDLVKENCIRRLYKDPMTRDDEWGLRCYQDEPDDTSWCGQNVWDVYTKHEGKALDGSEYKDW